MRSAWLVVALALAIPGCAGCGYGVGPVEATAYIDAGFDENKTTYRERLTAEGFAVDEEYYGSLHGVRGDEHVWVRVAYGNASTEVRLHTRLHHDQFPDDEAGYREAQAYGEGQARLAQPKAQATLDALAQAVARPSPTLPTMQASISIC